MNEKLQLKIQANLDGELSVKEAREIEAILAADAEARSLAAELKNTSHAFSLFEQDLKLPETRQFFWSKIEREIRSLENKSGRKAESPGWFAAAFLRRLAIPIGTFAVIALVTVFAVQKSGFFPKSSDFGGVEIAMTDTEEFTYNDHAAGMTVVWLSYPAENEFTETDPADTLQ